MIPVDPGSAREFLEAVIAGFSTLGGGMAYFSGFQASQALAQNQPSEMVAYSVNEGIGKGFELFSPISAMALIIMVWS